MWRVFGGAALVVAGIAAFIEAHAHRPVSFAESVSPIQEELREIRGGPPLTRHSGLSGTTYDLLHIGAWALVIFGVVLLIVGLIRYWAAQRAPGTP